MCSSVARCGNIRLQQRWPEHDRKLEAGKFLEKSHGVGCVWKYSSINVFGPCNSKYLNNNNDCEILPLRLVQVEQSSKQEYPLIVTYEGPAHSATYQHYITHACIMNRSFSGINRKIWPSEELPAALKQHRKQPHEAPSKHLPRLAAGFLVRHSEANICDNNWLGLFCKVSHISTFVIDDLTKRRENPGTTPGDTCSDDVTAASGRSVSRFFFHHKINRFIVCLFKTLYCWSFNTHVFKTKCLAAHTFVTGQTTLCYSL